MRNKIFVNFRERNKHDKRRYESQLFALDRKEKTRTAPTLQLTITCFAERVLGMKEDEQLRRSLLYRLTEPSGKLILLVYYVKYSRESPFKRCITESHREDPQ